MIEQINFILSCLGEPTENRPLSKSVELIHRAFVKNKDLLSINLAEQRMVEMKKKQEEELEKKE